MNGFQKGISFQSLNFDFIYLMLIYPVVSVRIENHAEHGGTLNEHQLNRLVSNIVRDAGFII